MIKYLKTVKNQHNPRTKKQKYTREKMKDTYERNIEEV